MAERASWETYYLDLARTVASRATCSRRQVGAVIVKDNRIVATGYNGGPSGFPHCMDGACPRANSDIPPGQEYDSCIAIHAEANAIMFSSPEERQGAVLYCTQQPCFGCAKLIANSGIEAVVVSEVYDGYEVVRDFLHQSGLRMMYRRDDRVIETSPSDPDWQRHGQ